MFTISNKKFYFYKTYTYEYYTNISFSEYNKILSEYKNCYYYITDKKKLDEELIEHLTISIEEITNNFKPISTIYAFINFNILEVNGKYYKIDIENIKLKDFIYKKYTAISDNISIFYKYINKKLYPNIDLYGSENLPSICKIMSELNGLEKNKFIDYILNNFLTNYKTYLSISDIIDKIPEENPKLLFKPLIIDKNDLSDKNSIYILYDTYLNDIYFRSIDNLDNSVDKLLCLRNFLNYYLFNKKERFIYIDINKLIFIKANNIKINTYNKIIPNTLFIKLINENNNVKNNKNLFYKQPLGFKYNILFSHRDLFIKWIKDKYNNYHSIFIAYENAINETYKEYFKYSDTVYCNYIKIYLDNKDIKKKSIEDYIKHISIEYYKPIESYYIILLIHGIINGNIQSIV